MNDLNKSLIVFYLIFCAWCANLNAQLTPTSKWTFEAVTTTRHSAAQSFNNTQIGIAKEKPAVGKSFLRIEDQKGRFLIRDWQVSDQFGVSFWVRMSAEAQNGVILSKASTRKDKDKHLSLEVGKKHELILIAHTGDGEKLTVATPDNILYDEEWAHFVINVDTNYISLLINGSESGRVYKSSPLINERAVPLCIGNLTDQTSVKEGFIGDIDDILFFDHPLTSTEIESIIDGSNMGLEAANVSINPKIAYHTLYVNNAEKVRLFQIENRDGELNTEIIKIEQNQIDISTLSPGSYKIYLVNDKGEVIEDHFVKL